jgi:hypothetical protein
MEPNINFVRFFFKLADLVLIDSVFNDMCR